MRSWTFIVLAAVGMVLCANPGQAFGQATINYTLTTGLVTNPDANATPVTVYRWTDPNWVRAPVDPNAPLYPGIDPNYIYNTTVTLGLATGQAKSETVFIDLQGGTYTLSKLTITEGANKTNRGYFRNGILNTASIEFATGSDADLDFMKDCNLVAGAQTLIIKNASGKA